MVVHHTKVRDHIYSVDARGILADSNYTGQGSLSSWEVRMCMERMIHIWWQDDRLKVVEEREHPYM